MCVISDLRILDILTYAYTNTQATVGGDECAE